ncbi:cyclic nucleotide-binding domain-containing protein [Amycolatopsis sp. NPDC005232]|uniref:cyclic nucleotide-binding domain-containing protein n=1 Tax=Amycolatopsis sp. NPDC005232 TaxID=3157027 RepID=UPI0033BB99E6
MWWPASLESGTARHYPRGEVIFHTGEHAGFGYLVVAGKVAMGRTTPTGRERLMTLFLPGDPFGITSNSLPDRHDVIEDIVAKGDRVWAVWSLKAIHR